MSGNGFYWRTAADPAAIALVVVPALPRLLDRRPPAVGRARFACLLDCQDQVVDEVVVMAIAEDYWEMACHGGQGVRQAVTRALHDQGVPQLYYDPLANDERFAALAQVAHPAALPLLAQSPQLPIHAAWWPYVHRLPRVLITGPTNAGKSTLLNAWCGQQRALASDQAGTTRDLLQVETQHAGWRLQLIDSAGLRATSDALESAGQALVAEISAQVDVVVHCHPAPEMPGDSADGGIELCTKADLLPHPPSQLYWAAAEYIGAQRSEALLQALGDAVLRHLGLPIVASR